MQSGTILTSAAAADPPRFLRESEDQRILEPGDSACDEYGGCNPLAAWGMPRVSCPCFESFILIFFELAPSHCCTANQPVPAGNYVRSWSGAEAADLLAGIGWDN